MAAGARSAESDEMKGRKRDNRVAERFGAIGPPPKGMLEQERVIWKQRVDDWPFLTREHRCALQIHCQLCHSYNDQLEKLRGEGEVLERPNKTFYPNPRSSAVSRLRTHLMNNLKAMGATPLARKGVTPPEEPEEETVEGGEYLT